MKFGRLHAGEDSCLIVGTGYLYPKQFRTHVEKLVYGGDGLARLDGRVVLVHCVPNERARRHPAAKPGLVRARLLEGSNRLPSECRRRVRISAAAAAAITSMPPMNSAGGEARDPGGGTERLGKIEPRRRSRRCPPSPGRTAIGRVAHRPICRWAIGSPVQNSAPSTSARFFAKLNEVIAKLTVMLRDPKCRGSSSRWRYSRRAAGSAKHPRRTAGGQRFFEWCARKSQVSARARRLQGRFRVGANSFFQVNRFLTDRLVEWRRKGWKDAPRSTLLGKSDCSP